jgi:hypothetical protein
MLFLVIEGIQQLLLNQIDHTWFNNNFKLQYYGTYKFC